MRLAELHELLQNGDSSGVEFKRDDIHPDSLAKEIAALANLEGLVDTPHLSLSLALG